MRRGDLVTVALPGDLGKPRPALVIQSDGFVALSAVTVLPVTSTEKVAQLVRVPIDPLPGTGLQQRSYVMIDKPTTPPRTKIRQVIGRVDDDTMRTVDLALMVFLGLS